MNNYELLCVLPGTLAEDEVAPIVDKIKETLKNKEAQNIVIKDMGKSKLAYPIKHIRYGYFQLFHFELENEKTSELERSIRLLGNIIRVTLRTYDPKKDRDYILAVDPTAPSAKEKPENVREYKSFKKEKKETAKEESEPIKETSNIESEKSEENKTVEEIEVKKPKTKRIKTKKEEISIDEIDKKLEEILKKDIDNV
ncbi:MAG: 30S ribosomal protein S6 [Patescibacteria group bacterium]